MPPIPPIAKGEFLQLLQRCIPPVGWPETLAVGNSAGPDSTCLLHLLSSVINTKPSPGLPARLLSIHIDHALQESSGAMAKQAEQTAQALGVEHRQRTTSWPIQPKPGEPFEEVARGARSFEFLQAMDDLPEYAVAYGHHVDDLVETAIMRLYMGSSLQHACGMRPVRRWGMSNARARGPLQPLSPAGMSRWVVRPLLSVSKDRILATCDANGWQYVNDPTNFQPDITLRNAIRYKLLQEDSLDVTQAPLEVPLGVTNAIKRLREFAPTTRGRAGLHEAVGRLGRQAEMIDTRVTNHLESCVVASPPSTLVLSVPELLKITDPEVRIALVRRVLRYVSPRPWGSPRAEAGGRWESLQAFVRTLWSATSGDYSQKVFTHGGNVGWRPVAIRPGGNIKERAYARLGETSAWLACRLPPASHKALEKAGRQNPVIRDITGDLEKMQPGDDNVMMYDCRFALSFDKVKLPKRILETITGPNSLARIVIEPADKWYIPQIVWRQDGKEDEVLARYDWQDPRRLTASPRPIVDPSWVRMKFIRELSAL